KWTLYYSGDFDLNNAEFVEPVFWGFAQRNLDNPLGRVEFIDGRLYSVITEEIRLIPSRAGSYIIPPYRVVFPSDVFLEDGFEVVSNPLELSVLQLPEEPDDFIGLVGGVEVDSQVVIRDDLQAGDSFDVRLIISGNANLEQVLAP